MKLLRGVSVHVNGFRSTIPRYLTSTVSEMAGVATSRRRAATERIMCLLSALKLYRIPCRTLKRRFRSRLAPTSIVEIRSSSHRVLYCSKHNSCSDVKQSKYRIPLNCIPKWRLGSPKNRRTSFVPNKTLKPRKPLWRGRALALSCSGWPLRHIDDVSIGSYRDDYRIGLLTTSLIGGWCHVQLSAVSFARHKRVVLDYRLLEHGHVALARFDSG